MKPMLLCVIMFMVLGSYAVVTLLHGKATALNDSTRDFVESIPQVMTDGRRVLSLRGEVVKKQNQGSFHLREIPSF